MDDRGVGLTKICGLRELPHMLIAAEAGADLLGMVFLPGVRRFILPKKAQEMVQAFRKHYPRSTANTVRMGAGRTLLVGLFADQPADEVNRTAASVGVDLVQLCGNEGPEYWAQMQRPFLQVLHVPDLPKADEGLREQALASLEERLTALEIVSGLAMLDSSGPGGSGESFDWSLARELAERGHRFLLAGGLTPESVALAIATAHPSGVDVSSGVETDGIKDPAKIQAFIQAAQRAMKREEAPCHG